MNSVFLSLVFDAKVQHSREKNSHYLMELTVFLETSDYITSLLQLDNLICVESAIKLLSTSLEMLV